jgi:hypothetical protein
MEMPTAFVLMGLFAKQTGKSWRGMAASWCIYF